MLRSFYIEKFHDKLHSICGFGKESWQKLLQICVLVWNGQEFGFWIDSSNLEQSLLFLAFC